MSGQIPKLVFVSMLLSAGAQAAADIPLYGDCPPCIELPEKASCVCRIGRWEYEEGEQMRLTVFEGNNSLLSETECRCARGGEAGRAAIRRQTSHYATRGRIRRQSGTCRPTRRYIIEERGDSSRRNATKADICFVVDESGSMVDEHEWLNTTVMKLENALRHRGIQVRFCLVGYGTTNRLLGEFIIDLGTAAEVQRVIDNLLETGQKEDGYSAMYQVLNNNGQFSFDPEAAKVIVLVSDEDRDQLMDQPVSRNINYNGMLKEFTDNGVILNVVVNQYFKDANVENYVLGVDYKNRSFWYKPGSPRPYETNDRGYAVFDGGYGTTKDDYVSLSFRTNGSAWDLQQLRHGNDRQVEAFTEAFVGVKVDEITTTLTTCEVCDCPDLSGTLRCRNDSTLPIDKCVIEACFVDDQEVPSGHYCYTCNPTTTVDTAGRIERVSIIFVIDESGSMEGDQNWFKRQFISRIDRHLRKVYSIGSTEEGKRNKFGLFGFASRNRTQQERTGYKIVESTEQYRDKFDVVDFAHNGKLEDGYSAIKRAADYLARQRSDDGVQKMIVLVTDEDRDVVMNETTRETLRDQLANASIRLDVVVSNSFESADGRLAIGVGSKEEDYPTFIIGRGDDPLPKGGRSIVDSGHGTTLGDYVELAWARCGVAWDINEVRTDNASSIRKDFARYFSKRIDAIRCQKAVAAKSSPMCQKCLCQSNLTLSCTPSEDVPQTQCRHGGIFPIAPTVVPTNDDIFFATDHMTGQTPAIISETPAIISETPAIISEIPAIISEIPAIMSETPAIISETPAIISEIPAIMSETPAPTTDFEVLFANTDELPETTAPAPPIPHGVEHDNPNPPQGRLFGIGPKSTCSRGAVKLMGSSSLLTYDKQFFTRSTKNVLTFCFKTILSNGVLVWIKQGRPMEGYILIQVIDGHVQAKMDLGLGNASVTHSLFVSDGQWHTLMFRRKDNRADIRIDGDKTVTMKTGEGAPDAEVAFRATGKWYIGKAGSLKRITNPPATADPFTGCVSRVRVNKKKVKLQKAAIHKSYIYPC